MRTPAQPALRSALLALGAVYLLAGAPASARPLARVAGPAFGLTVGLSRVVAAAPSVAPSVAPSAVQQRSEAEIRSEIAFARGLASSWGFVDLSQEVIAKLEASNLPSALSEEVNLLKCEVFYAAARNDAKNREALLKSAIDAYSTFLSRSSFSDESKGSAEAGLVEASSAYARTLAGRLEEAVGEEATTLRTTIQDVLREASRKAGELVEGYRSIPPDERTDAQKRKMFELMLSRGEMLLEMAKAQEDGTFNFEAARKAFEVLSDEAGEGTPWSLRAFIGIGDVDFAEAKYDEAAAYYEFAVNFSIPVEPEAWAAAVAGAGGTPMSTEEKQARFLFVQLGTPGLVKSYLLSGDQEAAIKWSLHLHNVWRREGLDLVQPTGYMALLEVARTMVDAGGVIGGNTSAGEARWFASAEEAAAAGAQKRSQRTALDFALSLAQVVANENKGTNLLVRAQKVIGEIISRPGVQVDPTVLFDAAQGDFNASDFAAAVPALKRVVLALESTDQATRSELMPKVLWHIGRSYARQDMTLEAAVTYEHALDNWNGDAVWDEQNATGFNSSVMTLKRQAKNDPLIEGLVRKSEQLLSKYSGDAANEILFRSAEKLFDAKKYDEARAKYREVKGGNSYEKALVALGLCDYREGKFEAAISVFRDYMEKFVPDAKNATTDPQKLAKRKEARANAAFYWGLSLYKQAEKGKGDWNSVVERLGKYHEDFPEQTKYSAAALYQTLMAYVQLNDQKSVRSVLETMLQLFPDDQYTGIAAKASYDALNEQRNKATDEASKARLLREMAENLQVLNRTSSKPSYPNMRTESKHWMDLGEWATAEDLLKRIRAQFASDPDAATDIQKVVLPDLGEALMHQYKVAEAADVLVPLMAEDAPVRASKGTAADYVRVITGWVEMTQGEGGNLGVPKEVPGVGVLGDAPKDGAKADPRSFYAAAVTINQLAGSAEKWSEEWLRLKFDQVYALHQWGKKDSKRAQDAKDALNFITNLLGPQFKGDNMPEDLRQMYVWLLAQVGR